ncbi:type II secretion system F family protein [Candidatus Woesearchaeota archaeon]|nr:type II secretion system F family protein [Candidatus Woesearchaeota archaeon]
MFKLPYSLLPVKALRNISPPFYGIADYLGGLFPFLKLNLKQAELDFSVKEYLGMSIVSCLMFLVFFGTFFILILLFAGVEKFLSFGLVITAVITLFVFMQQIAYPKLYSHRRIKSIERNMLAALQNILIQLNSGVPLFDILVNMSKGDYGEVSREFSRVVREINAGKPQVETLEEMAAVNPSLFFRRAIWQLVNGMKSGADMSSVVNEIIDSLSEEQILQIQRYGSQLNPLAMFYMLAVVIAPSLGMTFLIILSSFISMSEFATKLIFWGLYGIIIFFQIMFMGIIKSKRPNLLRD